jgi:hypothetical protein
VRKMRNWFAAVALAATVALAAPNAGAQVSDRVLPVGNATSLRLNVSGSIHVIPVAGLTSIKFHVVDNGPSIPPMSVRASRSGTRLDVSITGPDQSVLPFAGASGYELQLQYPAGVHLDLRQNAGRVHVDNVPVSMQLYDAQGNIVVDNTAAQLTAYAAAGDISVSNARTSITLTADTGNVSAGLAPGWRGSLVRLEASNGNLHLSVPSGFKAHYDITSAAGHVSNPLRSTSAGPLIFMLTEQGDVSIETV